MVTIGHCRVLLGRLSPTWPKGFCSVLTPYKPVTFYTASKACKQLLHSTATPCSSSMQTCPLVPACENRNPV